MKVGVYIFEKISDIVKKNLFYSVPLVHDFWEDFEFEELTQNMRQKLDPIFGEILDRVRVGSPTSNDIIILETRIVKVEAANYSKIDCAVEQFMQLKHENIKTLCLFPTIVSTNDTNLAISETLKIKCLTVQAIDSGKPDFRQTKVRKNQVNKQFKISTKKSETAGLESNLYIGIGSSVMLTRNLETNSGLVNGAIGEVIDIDICKKRENSVNKILIEFSNIDEHIWIERFMADFDCGKSDYITRAQFPLTLAWAISIHKSQGLSLDSTILDLGSDIFEGGMAYVALSRARVLNKVYLIEFLPSSLYCCPEAYQEYQRLYRCSNIPSRLPLFINTYKSFNKNNISKKHLNTNPPENKHTSNNEFLSSTINTVDQAIFKYYPLKLTNHGQNNCFANSVTQALLHMHPFFYQYLDSDPEYENQLKKDYLKKIKDFFNICYNAYNTQREPISTSILRAHLTEYHRSSLSQYNGATQDDCFLFLTDFINSLNQSVRKLFMFDAIVKSKCKRCTTEHNYANSNNSHIDISLNDNNRLTDLTKALKLISYGERTCRSCKINTDCIDETTLILPESNKFVIVYVPNFKYVANKYVKLNTRLDNINHQPLIVNNSTNTTFQINSIILRLGDTVNNGHFKIWAHNLQTNKWLLIDDSVVRVYKELYKSLDNVNIIVLKRLN